MTWTEERGMIDFSRGKRLDLVGGWVLCPVVHRQVGNSIWQHLYKGTQTEATEEEEEAEEVANIGVLFWAYWGISDMLHVLWHWMGWHRWHTYIYMHIHIYTHTQTHTHTHTLQCSHIPHSQLSMQGWTDHADLELVWADLCSWEL